MSEGYPIYKGLQMPLEFMGIRGRFLIFAAAAIGTSFIGFLIVSLIFGQLVGFVFLGLSIVVGLATIYLKQRTGLHSKKRERGVMIYHNLFKNV